MNTLVLGVGNLLLQDEGAGVRALDAFESKYRLPPGVEFLDGGTSGLELLYHIEGRDCLIIIDVVKSGKPPGTVTAWEGEGVPAVFRQKISPHQLGISDLLATLQLTGRVPLKLLLLGIEPKLVDTGLELSGEVLRGLDDLVAMLALELAALGFCLAVHESDAKGGRETGSCAFSFPADPT